jgi:hypothetical protein
LHRRSDDQGSIVAISDAAGTQLFANVYDEYGVPGSSNYGRFDYTGQIWLPELEFTMSEPFSMISQLPKELHLCAVGLWN